MVREASAGMVSVLHTADLTREDLAAARALCDAAFDDFGDPDWEHALGGLHALAHEDGVVVAHGALVMRRMLHGGRALRCGYVEAVAVHPDRRRAGLASAVMASLEELAPAYDLLALSASDDGVPLYESGGWLRWRGRTSALTPEGLVRTAEDDDSVYVLLGEVPLDLDGPIACDWREGDVW